MKDKQRAELLDILKVLLEEDLSWFELRTPTTYIRIGAGPEVLSQPVPAPTGNGQATAAPPAAATPPTATPVVVASPAPAPTPREVISEKPARKEPPAPAPAPAAGGHVVTAPFAGVFYRRPSPAEPPFVEVGSRVRASETVCLVEVMKLFNSVQAGVDGVVTAIEANDGELVEYGQPLMRIAPTGQA